MRTYDGSRRRAPGGVFFSLLTKEEAVLPALKQLRREKRKKFKDAEAERKANTCAICLEVKASLVGFEGKRTESWSSEPCKHRFCSECLTSYIVAKLDDATWHVLAYASPCLPYRLPYHIP